MWEERKRRWQTGSVTYLVLRRLPANIRQKFPVENGSGPLRAQVPFLAPSHREYGVMQVLKQVLRQNGEVSSEDFTKAH